MSFRFPLAREADPSQIDERATETRFPHVDHGTNKMKSELSAAVSLIVLLAPSFGHEPLLSSSGKCTGIQRMQPIPRQLIKEHIVASEYRAWVAERKAEPRRPATPEDSGTHVRKQ